VRGRREGRNNQTARAVHGFILWDGQEKGEYNLGRGGET